MPYPYSWTPSRVPPSVSAQVSVLNASGSPAALSTAVAVSAGNITFSLTNLGTYTIVVRANGSQESGTFAVDATGVDISNPEFLSYMFSAPDDAAGSSVPASSLSARILAEVTTNTATKTALDKSAAGKAAALSIVFS